MIRLFRAPSVLLRVPQCRYIANAAPKFQLPSEKEARRSPLGKKTTEFLDRTQLKMMAVLQRVNDVSGYSEIEKLKKRIAKAEEDAKISRDVRESASAAYQQAVTERSASQREVNELLQRKHDWNSQDLERFTQLFREDHLVEQRVQQTKAASLESEAHYDACQAQLHQLISSRYREEQIWSDKIRQVSTWGTVLLMAFNVLLFLVVQLGLEPWKRRRLVGSFEEKVLAALDARLPSEVESPIEPEPQPELVVEEHLSPKTLWERLQAPTIVLQPFEAAGLLTSALALGVGTGLYIMIK